MIQLTRLNNQPLMVNSDLIKFVEKAPDTGVREIILGMTHRGRLNVLANILRKPYQELFAEFEDSDLRGTMDGDGDVKYHLGFASDRLNTRGQAVHGQQ